MFSMPGTVVGGKWIRGAVNSSSMVLINMFSSCWYFESDNLLLDVLFSFPNQLLLSWKLYSLNSIFPVSGIQAPESSLTLISSFFKQKKGLVSYGFTSGTASSFTPTSGPSFSWLLPLTLLFCDQFFLWLVTKAYFLIKQVLKDDQKLSSS